MYDYIIIGNGIAGFTCAKQLRDKENDAKILIISKEKNHTYWRTRLSDLICKEFCIEETLVKKQEWYEDFNVDERLDTEVVKIDRDKKVVILENGEELEYKKALIASGAHCFIPPIENSKTECVFSIRSLDDLIKFKDTIKNKKKVIIIGGGLLGLEAAYSISKLGLETLVIETNDYLLSKQLDCELSEKLRKELSNLGIKSITGKSTKKILEKDGKAYGIELDDGNKYEADAIMIQAGIRNNLDIAKNSNLDTDRGICVDESLRTKDDNIFAAGDCAQIGNTTIGLWTAAQEMGKIAANNMMGEDEKYELPKPFSSLLLGDLKLFSAGFSSGEGIEEIRKEDGDNIYKLFKKDGNFVGGILWKNTKYQADVKKIVFEGEDPKNTKLGKEVFCF